MTLYSSKLFVTTLFAATTQKAPNLTPGKIVTLSPIQEWAPISTLSLTMGYIFCISKLAFGPDPVIIVTLDAILTLFPIINSESYPFKQQFMPI
ncbi:hypothetical protein FGAF848_34770 [Escherichia coli]|uniref:Uncharacterized protein n=1 Tax=Escherichia coli TaxID=562 RepID=A0AAD2GKX2_ECOLX|nr:hypothetical protein FGAF848_34770 [Escherichia coli]CTS19129.1 Uncharacterised protein [Escherichia coli]CTU25444.1 Uncharacterised protein [Escherichia coli]